MIIINKYLVRKGYAAIAIFPFIFFKRKEYINSRRLNHEKIHLKQQLELLIILFYIWYFLEFLVKWIKYKNSKIAYYNISFEKEAYKNEYKPEYLKTRKSYSFLKY